MHAASAAQAWKRLSKPGAPRQFPEMAKVVGKTESRMTALSVEL